MDGKRLRYRFAGWDLNLRTRRLTSPSGAIVPLTKGELDLLTALLQAPQRVPSPEQLLAASRVHDTKVFDRAIDVQILRLRRKLEVDRCAPVLIQTERGAGYILQRRSKSKEARYAEPARPAYRHLRPPDWGCRGRHPYDQEFGDERHARSLRAAEAEVDALAAALTRSLALVA
jgi:DNA-binding winged helix-turn-helix (wHTH) protein